MQKPLVYNLISLSFSYFMFFFVQKHEFDVIKMSKTQTCLLVWIVLYEKVNFCSLNIIEIVAFYFYLQRKTVQLRFEACKHTIYIWSKRLIVCKRLKH